MMRWVAALALTIVAASVLAVHDYLSVTPDDPLRPFAGLLRYMAEVLPRYLLPLWPTILLYRVAIFVGDRILPRRRPLGAIMVVAAVALIPPIILNQPIYRAQAAHRDYAEAPRAGFQTVALRVGIPMNNGIIHCSEDCQRLLYGNRFRRVIIVHLDKGARSGKPTAYSLRIERRPVCAATESGDRDPRHPKAILTQTDGPTAVAALIAEGQCVVAEPASIDDAEILLGGDGWQDRLSGGDFEYVEQREGKVWRRIGQHTVARRGQYSPMPFVIAFQTRLVRDYRSDEGWRYTAEKRRRRWSWAGIPPIQPTAPDVATMRRVMTAALALPPAAPRDARHQFTSIYLSALGDRPLDPADRALLPKIIADGRIPLRDLKPMSKLRDGGATAQLLLDRLASMEPINWSDIRELASIVRAYPVAIWPALLPSVRRFAADTKRRGAAPPLFELFAAGTAADADTLLAIYARRSPDRIAALSGLCMLADRSDRIRPALIAAVKLQQAPDDIGDPALWRVLAGMDVDIEAVAEASKLPHFARMKIRNVVERAPRCGARADLSGPPLSLDYYGLIPATPSRMM